MGGLEPKAEILKAEILKAETLKTEVRHGESVRWRRRRRRRARFGVTAVIIPRLRRLFFAGVLETYNSHRLLASPGIAQTPIVPAASARF